MNQIPPVQLEIYSSGILDLAPTWHQQVTAIQLMRWNTILAQKYQVISHLIMKLSCLFLGGTTLHHSEQERC
jgi:hypothetical protein